jgi:transcriptional regulator with XRE-family HTH domain
MNEVKKLIALSGLTQKALAEKLGTKPERITEYKNGKHEITVNKLKKWCEILNIDIKYLF